jgi:NAD(P)-dependent dehydrogenase (short-subunit alcohol dehydrogenase family)
MDITTETAAIVSGGASGLGLATATALRAAGAAVAIFDMNAERGEAAAAAIGAAFCHVNIMEEQSCLDGFERARAVNGQERIFVGCAGGGSSRKTISRNRETGEIVRFPTAEYERNVLLNMVGSFRCITMTAAGMAGLDPVNADGERGVIVLTASVAAQDLPKPASTGLFFPLQGT